MNQSMTRIPLDNQDIVLFDEPTLTKAMCTKLLDFYRDYQEKNVAFFLTLRKQWHHHNPGRSFPGLCANINPITGEFRTPAEQKIWGWGDGRALGIWSVFLNMDRIADKEIGIRLDDTSEISINLLSGMEEYVDVIYTGLVERYRQNAGVIPFAVDLDTEDTPALDSRGFKKPSVSPSEKGIGFSNTFAINGFLQYGIFRKNSESFQTGLDILKNVADAITDNRFSISVKQLPADTMLHGPRMITLGVIGEVLNTFEYIEKARGDQGYRSHRDPLVEMAIPFIEHILSHHYRDTPSAFWEYSTTSGEPMQDSAGFTVIDPGHASECAGFLAELVPFLPESWGSTRWDRKTVLEAALRIHLFADRIGFLESGAMTKYADLHTGKPLPDTQAADAQGRMTAPWWNVREHCAAALRLYTLTRDTRLLETYRKAQRASYVFYPNKRIGGQMIQTIDPVTLEPLDIAPATGNLDPMHDSRARLREIENLEILLGAR